MLTLLYLTSLHFHSLQKLVANIAVKKIKNKKMKERGRETIMEDQVKYKKQISFALMGSSDI